MATFSISLTEGSWLSRLPVLETHGAVSRHRNLLPKSQDLMRDANAWTQSPRSGFKFCTYQAQQLVMLIILYFCKETSTRACCTVYPLQASLCMTSLFSALFWRVQIEVDIDQDFVFLNRHILSSSLYLMIENLSPLQLSFHDTNIQNGHF